MFQTTLRSSLISLVLLLTGPVLGQASETNVPITVDIQPLLDASACSGRFVAHDLDHITKAPGETIQMFEANGSGLGINDLDNDGDLDIVLANHAGMSTILWNEGHLQFRMQRLSQSDARAVTLIDVDGDGWQDIVFSHRMLPPAYWRNRGQGQFMRDYLPGVNKPLYAINWGDLDRDGDLDLVGATYDASLLVDYGQEFFNDGKGGVYVYENQKGYFSMTSLATSAQGLALLLVDLNQDGFQDIWVGNDFAVPDYIWTYAETGWQPKDPIVMSHSTMSLDTGDINNDGQDEVLSTDMKFLNETDKGEIALRGITDEINADRILPDPQVTANVLQTVGTFKDQSATLGLDATGWSWSGKFGDLNQDGFLDVYVVNGFIEADTFDMLPNGELVEPNQAFMNREATLFQAMPAWGLGSLRSGRGMSMADLDDDGDLDLVVNNLNSAAELFENQLCEGHSLQIDLRWPDTLNTRAIGARLTLSTDRGTYTRDVKAASGYLSGDPSRVHIGVPDEAMIQSLLIQWPDGVVSQVGDVGIDTRLVVSR